MTLAHVRVWLCLVALCACKREERQFTEIAPLSALATSEPHSGLSPGAQSSTGDLPRNARGFFRSPYDENVWSVSEGKRLFNTINCQGCHAQGGGGMGAALLDNRWRYGSEPANVFASIIEGRPNGMPSYRGKLTEGQTWQLVSYVRALAGILELNVQPGRSDTLSGRPAENVLKHGGRPAPRPEGVP